MSERTLSTILLRKQNPHETIPYPLITIDIIISNIIKTIYMLHIIHTQLHIYREKYVKIYR